MYRPGRKAPKVHWFVNLCFFSWLTVAIVTYGISNSIALALLLAFGFSIIFVAAWLLEKIVKN